MSKYDYDLPGGRGRKRVKTRPSKTHANDGLKLTKEARLLRETYIFYRRVTDGNLTNSVSSYQPPKSFDGRKAVSFEDKPAENGWNKTARKLKRKGINTTHYVYILFKAIVGTTRIFPRPQELAHNSYVELYLSYSQQHAKVVREKVQYEFEIAKRHVAIKVGYNSMSTNLAILDVVTDNNLPLSKLFRFCLAVNVSQEDHRRELLAVAKRLYDDAVFEYFPSREIYDAVYRDLLPTKLRKRAATKFQQIMNRVL